MSLIEKGYMKIKKEIALIMAFFVLGTYANKKLLYIDTSAYADYHVHYLMTLAKAVGFIPIYKQFYQLNAGDLDNPTTIILHLDNSFINALLHTKQSAINPLSNIGIALLNTIAKQQNKVIILLLPNSPHYSLQQKILQLLSNNIFASRPPDYIKNQLRTFLFDWLLQPDASKSTAYQTALLCNNKLEPAKPYCNQPLIHDNAIIATGLPQKNSNPLSFYFYDTTATNHYVVSKKSLLTFAEINENYVYNPLDEQLRKATLKELHEFFYDVHYLALHKTLPSKSQPSNATLPILFNSSYKHKIYTRIHKQQLATVTNKPLKNLLNNKIWLGWTELRTYKNKERQAAQNILKSGLNSLWIELVLERYFSNNGVHKNDATQFLDNLAAFLQALHEESRALHMPMPLIFAGINVTGNFHTTFAQNKLAAGKQAVDAYGNVYDRIPSPLDRSFWQEEVIIPFQKFMQAWQDLAPHIPMHGIFIDLEMYNNGQTGEYENLMDFSDISWHIYAQANPTLENLTTTDQRVGYLLQHNLFDHYIHTLQQAAKQLGKELKQEIEHALPQAIIGIYSINPPYKWFYTGLLAGLSTPEKPIILATFNTEFYPHYTWLKKQHIHAMHIPVFMLSKLQSAADKKIIEDLAKNNDGVWFNRISHWEESRDKKDWLWDYSTEVTPLSTEACINILSALHE